MPSIAVYIHEQCIVAGMMMSAQSINPKATFAGGRSNRIPEIAWAELMRFTWFLEIC